MEIDSRVGNSLRFEVKRHLGDAPNIVNSLREIRTNPDNYNRRISEFHEALNAFNEIVASDEDPGDGYLYVGTFLGDMPSATRKPFLTLQEIFLQNGRRAQTPSLAADTFWDIDAKIKGGDWRYLLNINDSNVLTSALLIEGYGLFLEKSTGEEGIARRFVLGFEEVLWHKFRDSEMLKDVLPWMIEERYDFSDQMRTELEEV